MANLTQIDKKLLEITADLHGVPQGAYNIRKDGKLLSRGQSANITIETKTDKSGIDIIVKPNTKNESVHIPVILAASGLNDLVYNDFYIGKNADVVIVAGCAIHNCGNQDSTHSGIHRFFLEDGAKVKYIERHYGEGEKAKKILNPTTEITLKPNAEFIMETSQIGGVSYTDRRSVATLAKNAKLDINEKILTEQDQYATTSFEVNLNGENSSAHLVSRAVAKNQSRQEFVGKINGNSTCFGHSECDAIVMDNATVLARPEVNAFSADASLIHEAAIGKIAGDQIIKLMTLGLTEKQAEEQIIKGFLR